MTMLIDGDDGNRVPSAISIRYSINGAWVPKHGAFTTKRYWTQTIEVKEGDAIVLQAINNNNRVTVDIVMAKDNPRRGEARILCHDDVYGKGTAQCGAIAAS